MFGMREIVEKVEKKTNFTFAEEDVYKIIAHVFRKCQLNRKDDSYVPILFENELYDFIMRLRINEKGATTNV